MQSLYKSYQIKTNLDKNKRVYYGNFYIKLHLLKYIQITLTQTMVKSYLR